MIRKIKILFLAACPVDLSYHPRFDIEVREIEDAIFNSRYRDVFELTSRLAVRPCDIQRALLMHGPHIVHFSGHGTFQGISLEDDLGKQRLVNKDKLIEVFRVFKDNIRVVFFNACHSMIQIETLAQTIDFTIGMSAKIDDRVAIAFASSFYGSLASGNSVKNAFESAKECSEYKSNVPQLLVREGVNFSESFLNVTK